MNTDFYKLFSIALFRQLKTVNPAEVFFCHHYTVQWILCLPHLNLKCFLSSGSAGKEKHKIKEKKMCPHISIRAHTTIAIFKKKATWLESRQDCGMKTCGSKSTTDWISWLRWMKGICSFVTWFSTVTEWAFSSCPDCRPLRLSKNGSCSVHRGQIRPSWLKHFQRNCEK